MNKRVARLSLPLLLLLFLFGLGQRTLTLTAETAGQQFILCAPEDRIAAVMSRHGLTMVRPLDDNIRSIALVVGPVPQQQTNAVQGDTLDAATQQLIQEVRADSDVEHFDVNGAAVVTEIGSSPQLNESMIEILDSLEHTVSAYFGNSVWTPYVNQPALNVIKVAQAQQFAHGDDVVVAIIDTGVDPHHPALQGVLVPGYDFTRDLAGPASEWADLSESMIEILDSANVSILGPSAPVAVNSSTVAMVDSATAAQVDVTHLPSAFGHGTMVAGLVHVVAPKAKIMPLKAFRADGSSNAFDIERAIVYAVNHGAKVINMSFSSVTTSAELTHAIDYATLNGVICLASAGNSGRRSVVFPAGYRNVMGIASTTNSNQRSGFSNHGDHLVQFAVPGESLITIYPGGRYAAVSGTSFSTALMSGGVSLLSQLQPTVDHRLAGRYFDDGAVKLPNLELGDGRIDLFETLRTHAPAGPPPDTTAPNVALTSPAAGGTVTGVYPLAVNASDNVAVVSVQFTLDGVSVGEATTTPFTLNWDSTTAPSGGHVLRAVARDAAGNQSVASVNVTVTNDTVGPTVTVTSPADGSTVTGSITLIAAASDNVGVAGVQFTLDGVNLGAERTAPPYQMTWNSSAVANGVHVIAAIARDAAGNSRLAASVGVTVNNDTTAPTVAVTTPIGGAVVAGSVVFDAAASDNVGVAGVQFTLDGVNIGWERTAAPYTITWNSASVANGTHVIAAIARDAAGNTQTAASVTITVNNDTTAPVAAITSPLDAAVVAGSIMLAVDATDNVGVVGVQFVLDGVNLGPEITTGPYQRAWNSATVANGTHVLTAVARDAAGNQRTVTATIVVTNVL